MYRCRHGLPAETTTGYCKRHTADCFCGISGTDGSAAPTASCPTLRPRRGSDARAWRLLSGSGACCTRTSSPYSRLVFGELVGATSRRSGRHTALQTKSRASSGSRQLSGRRQQGAGGVQWHAGVIKGAARFMTAWHKEEEDTSRKRATKRAIKAKSSVESINEGAGAGQQRRSETAQEENKEKRRRVSRAARHVADWCLMLVHLRNTTAPPPDRWQR